MVSVLGKNVYINANTFTNNQTIVNVDLCNVPFVNNSMRQAFSGCYNIRNITNISNTVTDMDFAFSLCYNLVDSPIIPNSITKMNYTYQYCYNLVNVPTIPNSVSQMYGTFQNCRAIVSLPDIPYGVTDIRGTFKDCVKLQNAPHIPNTVINMSNSFEDCYKLVNAPAIPNSVTNMYYTFQYCNSLVNAPDIPDSVTNMYYTFRGCSSLVNAPKLSNNVSRITSLFMSCSSLVNAPVIPNSVTAFDFTFSLCTSLVNAPVIPNSVTSMYMTFYYCNKMQTAPIIPNSVNIFEGTFEGCTNLTGNIYIQSENITNARNCFNTTSLIKNVYIPFTYDNGVNTATYNSFITAGYDEIGTRNNVYLKDIVKRITINATPNTASVRLIDRNVGGTVSLDDWTYTNTNNDYEIQSYIGSNTSVIVPSIYTSNSIKTEDNHIVDYIVSQEGYETVSNTVTVSGTETIDVTLEPIMCTYTVAPMPADATVTLTASGGVTYYSWYVAGDNIRWYTLTETPAANDPLYDYYGGELHPSNPDGESIVTYDSSTSPPRMKVWTLGDSYWATRDTTTDIIVGPTQEGNSITVPYGTEVSYTVSKNHYVSQSGTDVVKTTGSKYIPLAINQHTFTINPTPADSAVQILVNGRLVNVCNSDWVMSGDNLNENIELQNYIGSSTTVTMPTSYETTNTITADYGSVIEWKVSKDEYKSQTGTLTLEQDTVLNVEITIITHGVDVSDYNYTLNNKIVTLTEYIGEGGYIDTPEIEEI